ncbi:sensor histidine kinase [Krasilnikovia sp. MM14-A1259]|uniref:sensor histidine kinase n=1 Tax=Krasilnikovia sp. MM14-A1259 TaxID=3373539 RepID=UPI00382A4F08
MPDSRIPLHRSLLLRLLVTSITVALCAVAATAWLAVRTTSRAIQQAQGRSLADDGRIYDRLLGYAATHSGWAGVDPLIQALAAETGREITLTDASVHRIAGAASPLPARLTAVVDPLHVDAALRGDAAGEIDPRAVGPWQLTAAERRDMRARAGERIRCLREHGYEGRVTESPSGRTTITLTAYSDGEHVLACGAFDLLAPTTTEKRALDAYQGLVAGCLRRQGSTAVVTAALDFTVRAKTEPPMTDDRVRDCAQAAHRDQLRPYVAPAARLYIADPGRRPDASFDLSDRNIAYLAGVTGLVLLLAVAVTVVVGRRLVRPLRLLTAAAQRPLDAAAPVPVRGDDEIGRLAAAFNDLSERRAASEQQRTAMVSDIAHELRSPLANMRIWLEAAQDGLATLDPELLDLLTEEAVLLQHVVDDLRDLAAADAGSLRLHREVVFVDDLLRQAADAQRGAAHRGGVELTLSAEADPEVDADPVRLRQIVANLLSNAVRHTPAGGRVELRSTLRDGALVISVTDTGPGIAPEDLPHVFDRFWRADKSRSRATGGSGLGLAIARNLARAHGGDLTVHSTPGQGSTFTLRLPA